MALRVDGRWLRDEHGRAVLLRGVNLGGDCKVPWPHGGTWRPTDFADHREVSFVGRPFPLREADEHLARIAHWGFDCLRLLTTWEAVEHAGPGRHDEDYLDYLAEVSRRAGAHGLYVFVDFHQDVWSRMTGGDGAPGWTLRALGLRPERIHAADAALVMQHRHDPDDPRPVQPDRYRPMSWTWNYQWPANGIAWSLFFAGRALCPGFTVDGRNIQDYLQDHYLAAQRAVAERLADQPHVIGFDTLNEPSAGWIGRAMTHRRTSSREGEPALPGPALSPFDGLVLASGRPVTVPWLELRLLKGGTAPVREETMNPDGVRLWAGEDPFRAAGAWDVVDGAPRVLREHFFEQVDFGREAWLPLVHAVADNVRAVRADWLVFAEKDAAETFFDPRLPGLLPPGTVNAGHWYDLVALMLKRHPWPVHVDVASGRPAFGSGGIRRMYRRQLDALAQGGGGIPTVVGEFGIPMDLAGGRSYRTGDFSAQARALSLMYDALDALWIGSMQWNYTATNRNDPRIGDQWNHEDLSIFSRDQQHDPSDPDAGGRAVDGFCRPYARAVQGTPGAMAFDRRSGRFTLSWEGDPSVAAPTEVYVPRRVYGDRPRVRVEGVRVEDGPEAQRLFLWAEERGACSLVLEQRP